MIKLIIIYVLTSVMATYSSAYKLNQGCTEMNPLMPSTVKGQIGVKSISTAGISFGLYHLNKNNERVAKALAISSISVNIFDAVHNFKVRCN